MSYVLQTEKDIPYRTVDGIVLRMDLFFAKSDTDTPRPCALFFHGGGWREGCKEDVRFFPLITDLLLESGFVVGSAEYRLVGKNGGGFPQSVEDAMEAIRFLDRQSAVRIDPFRKAVFGISAGAHLALTAVLTDDPQRFSPVKTVVDLCGPAYMGGQRKPFCEVVMPPTTQKFIRDFVGSGNPEDASPLCLCEHPPQRPSVLIVQGDSDECVNPGISRMLYDRLMSNGFFAEYLEVENSNHTFHALPGTSLYPDAGTLYRTIGRFIMDNT